MKYFLATILVLLLVIIIGGGAFYFGEQSANQSKEMATTPTPTPFVTQETPTPQAMREKGKIVEGGGILVFAKYSLNLPEGWTSTREQNQNMDKLTLTKLGYVLTISQAAFGGGGCIYEGDTPNEFAQKFVSYVEIINPNGFIFRRGQNESSPNTYTVCQKNAQDGSFGSPTNFGAISLTTPGTPDKNAIIFPEVNSIVASLNKKI